MKRVLMIAFHYPPQAGSSGVQRTLKFASYLPRFGWEPIVLTAHPRAYGRVAAAVPDSVEVHRAFALDASRHLSLRGRYLRATALPDRWASWQLGAIPLGLRLCRERKFDALWSTYPIATAHKIGLSLQRRTGLPWIADFRDPMTEPGFPPDPAMHRAYANIERATLASCSRAVFTTEGTRGACLRNFSGLDADRMCVIPNGYDEEDFAAATAAAGPVSRPQGRPFTLLHSGIVYPSERDPRPLFAALANLQARGVLKPENFQLILRAPEHEAVLRPMLAEYRIESLVQLQPPIPYREALQEMLAADALLVLQAANCNNQIPAKLYEYFRTGRPILALTDPAGDTASAMRAAGLNTIAPLDQTTSIEEILPTFIAQTSAGVCPAPLIEAAQQYSRLSRTKELAELLNTLRQ